MEAAHLCGFLIGHTCTTLPHQPHQSLSGHQYSYLSYGLSRTGCPNVDLLCSVSHGLAKIRFVKLCLFLFPSRCFGLLKLSSVFFDWFCFSAHLLEIKVVFYLQAVPRLGPEHTPPVTKVSNQHLGGIEVSRQNARMTSSLDEV